jgi:nitrile hydratase
MNGIHDMGGMQDMGPIKNEKNEPVFHAPWEGRVYAMSAAVTATRKLRLGLRPPIENLPAVEYLRMSYYELWLTSLTERLVASELDDRFHESCHFGGIHSDFFDSYIGPVSPNGAGGSHGSVAAGD